MKKLLLAFTIITSVAACKNGPEPIETTGAVQLLPSVAAYSNNIGSDTASAATPEVNPSKVANAPAKIVYIIRQPAQPAANNPTAPVNPVPAPVMTPVTPVTPTSPDTATALPSYGGTTAGTDVSPVIPQTEKKKGWNSATKGAVIGAGAGAIGGAILSKKKGLGAVIGGVVGAAGGYIIGKNIDKKNADN